MSEKKQNKTKVPFELTGAEIDAAKFALCTIIPTLPNNETIIVPYQTLLDEIEHQKDCSMRMVHCTRAGMK